jgi:amidase
MSELWRKGASDLAALIRDRKVSSVEVVQAHLERIDAVDGPLNAITLVLDDALANAKQADRQPPRGPLHGVPFTIKENIDIVGSATTSGIPAFADARPTSDAPVVERMKGAGAIPLARTNMPEFGLRISTDNPLRGRTHNPWDPSVVAGGSSGGEGVALAAGMTPLGLGNDIGGSLRNPAFCNGVCGLKPTTGRLPGAGSIPPLDPSAASQLMATNGPMARNVGDLRLALELLSGRHVRDPRSVDVPIDGPPAARTAALVTDLPMPAEFADAVRAAGRALEAAGYQVVETTPPDLDLIMTVWRVLMHFGLADELPILRRFITPPLAEVLEQTITSLAMPVATAFVERRRLQREWSAFFARHSVVVGPTWCDRPFPHDADLHPETGLDTVLERLQLIVPGNVLGLPATALPTGLGADGLPLGVQVYADLWRDDLSLAAAQVIEDALGTLAPIDPRSALAVSDGGLQQESDGGQNAQQGRN